jgi:hypothetical protein
MRDTTASVNIKALKAFLIQANKLHATGSGTPTTEADRSRTIEYTEGKYRMHDNFFGGEPYGGRLVIFYQDQPIFIEVYYGQTIKPAEEVYNFLREALQYPVDDNPYRGPTEYKKDNLTYKSSIVGDFTSHKVQGYIYEDGEEIYSAIIIGGLVDQNAKGAM